VSKSYYRGIGGEAPEQPVELPVRGAQEATHPRNYIADPGLVDAANTALLLRQPLLLTGEPGTGKTQFAKSLSWELGLGERVLRFDAKSHSKSRDLFYTVDTIGWFQVAQARSGYEATALDFLSYNAFGEAILRANDPDAIAGLVPSHFQHPGQKQRSVVLIDEVDKAPRDFPNDLLSEIEGMRFRVPELRNVEIAADIEFSPILIITSNSERDLPDAFLRRCVYYDIPFPDPERLKEIVRRRLREAVRSDDFIADALSLFDELRKPVSGLRKRPATAELLGWMTALARMGGDAANPLRDDPKRARTALPSLIKTYDDRDRATPIVDAWIRSRT
jgi:MoxR-like ATPase